MLFIELSTIDNNRAPNQHFRMISRGWRLEWWWF